MGRLAVLSCYGGTQVAFHFDVPRRPPTLPGYIKVASRFFGVQFFGNEGVPWSYGLHENYIGFFSGYIRDGSLARPAPGVGGLSIYPPGCSPFIIKLFGQARALWILFGT